ncbi:tyrosine-type recombinase/integrase [Streptomyces platensis]|nr:tyrosine-type recombinase/integrase [Streptomyces platensis]
MIRARVLRAPEIEKPPATLTSEQSQDIIDAARAARDRLLLSILLTGGLRIGEALGLRREDMHLLPDATHLGCTHRGAHLHVRPRQDNANGARAKSGRSRVVPLVQECVHRYRDHLAERAEVPGPLVPHVPHVPQVCRRVSIAMHQGRRALPRSEGADNAGVAAVMVCVVPQTELVPLVACPMLVGSLQIVDRRGQRHALARLPIWRAGR